MTDDPVRGANGGSRFPAFAALTTATTFALILLGVYTAASGAGLACSGQWPACDGGLLPTTLPSFIEWFHRLVASVVGVMILGTAVWAWRRYRSRRIRLATLGALLVLPSQLVLGGATVFVYTPLVQTAHHAAAMLIFAGLFAATLWAREAEITRDSRPAETTTPGATPGDD